MAAKLLWSLLAREDLLNIYVAIGMDNVEAAERLYSAIEAKTNLLLTHPRIGVRRSEIRPSARMFIEGPYLILYQTDLMQMRSLSEKSRLSVSWMDAAILRGLSDLLLPR